MDIGGRRRLESAGETTGVFGVPILRTPGEFYLADIPRGTVLIVLPYASRTLVTRRCATRSVPALFYPLSSTYFTSAFFLLPRVSFASSRRLRPAFSPRVKLLNTGDNQSYARRDASRT